MINTFKISFFTHLRYFALTYILLLIPFGVCIYLSEIDIKMFFLGEVLMAPFYLPGLLLNIEYFKHDKKRKVIFQGSGENLYIEFHNGDEIIIKRINQIRMIVTHKSGYHNRTPWNDTEFTIFYFTNGKRFTVTCLILSAMKLKKYFDPQIIHYKSRFRATLSYSGPLGY